MIPHKNSGDRVMSPVRSNCMKVLCLMNISSSAAILTDHMDKAEQVENAKKLRTTWISVHGFSNANGTLRAEK